MAKLNKDKTADVPVGWVVKPRRRLSAKNPKTKWDQLIRMLSSTNGACADAICQKLGWLPHSTRAAISGLRKSGLDVSSERPGPSKPRRYRIIANPAAEVARNAG